MCGRYASTRSPDALADEFAARLPIELAGSDAHEPDYNVAPTKQAPLLRSRRREDVPEREIILATWGLVPSWAKDRSIGNRMINARSETVHEKPAFRRAFARRRAVVPADGYYEWYGSDTPSPPGTRRAPKRPFYITSKDDTVLPMAGLYELWRADAEGDWLITFTVLTTSATDDVGRLHQRMPLIVEDVDAWLDPSVEAGTELLDLLVPAAPGRLEAWPVSTRVNHVGNNGPDLIRPLAAEETP